PPPAHQPTPAHLPQAQAERFVKLLLPHTFPFPL
ncbi:hypothetical protein A2U01_0093364, partial [Trifolium medium]|nr:hypothetical protein [Trifolium medium]